MIQIWLQNGLRLDENCCNQALKLFKETKNLLVANISAIGSGIVCFLVFSKDDFFITFLRNLC